MAKGPALLALLAAAALLSALFGAALSQLAFSVGTAHYTDVLFPRYGIPEDLHSRTGAALVGLQTGWWRGLALAVVPLVAAFVALRRGTTLLTAGGGVLALGAILALGGAMSGLAFGMILPGGTGEPATEMTEGARRAALMLQGAGYGALVAVPAGLWTVRQAARLDGALARQHARDAA